MYITPLCKRTRVNSVLNKGGSSAVCPFTRKIGLPVQNETFAGDGTDWTKACLLQTDSKYCIPPSPDIKFRETSIHSISVPIRKECNMPVLVCLAFWLSLQSSHCLTAPSCIHQSPYAIIFHSGRGTLPWHFICTSREGIAEALLISFLCELFPMITCMCRCLRR